jgi:hypothetical protein
MVQYKIMPSRFNSRCNETKEKLLKGAMIIYIPSEKRAYALTSQKADWLKINGEVVPETKPAPVIVPVQTVTTKPAPVVPAPAIAHTLVTVRPTRNGKWVWVPNN